METLELESEIASPSTTQDVQSIADEEKQLDETQDERSLDEYSSGVESVGDDTETSVGDEFDLASNTDSQGGSHRKRSPAVFKNNLVFCNATSFDLRDKKQLETLQNSLYPSLSLAQVLAIEKKRIARSSGFSPQSILLAMKKENKLAQVAMQHDSIFK